MTVRKLCPRVASAAETQGRDSCKAHAPPSPGKLCILGRAGLLGQQPATALLPLPGKAIWPHPKLLRAE